MNPYMLFLYIASSVYYSLGLDTIITAVKYIKMAGKMLSPDPKASIEKLRGNVIKVNLHGSDGDTFYLLPYSAKSKTWTRVEVVLNCDVELDADRNLEAAFKQLESDDNITVIDEDLNADIKSIETSKPLETNKRKYSKCPKHDVTNIMLSLSGPGKDFFGCPITPYHINRDYACLIFHYRKGKKLFESHDVLTL